MATGRCEDSISTTVDEPGFVETTCADYGICEDDASLEVLMVLVSIERCQLCQPEVTSGVKGCFNAILHERQGKGFYFSMMNDLFYEKK